MRRVTAWATWMLDDLCNVGIVEESDPRGGLQTRDDFGSPHHLSGSHRVAVRGSLVTRSCSSGPLILDGQHMRAFVLGIELLQRIRTRNSRSLSRLLTYSSFAGFARLGFLLSAHASKLLSSTKHKASSQLGSRGSCRSTAPSGRGMPVCSAIRERGKSRVPRQTW
jgi:hypothetical protein